MLRRREDRNHSLHHTSLGVILTVAGNAEVYPASGVRTRRDGHTRLVASVDSTASFLSPSCYDTKSLHYTSLGPWLTTPSVSSLRGPEPGVTATHGWSRQWTLLLASSLLVMTQCVYYTSLA
ncbi:hypothetical protein J6590_000697 [Homalodisca vitripennis]|nr:hypothetical protein J6590_000697 [Homalodisca vitripennis]